MDSKSSYIIEKKFRPEIEGIRALAAILVAVYHVWFGKVSGGVDVFFVISGFLITTSLLSRYESAGKIKFGDFYLNLARRLLPLAILTLSITAILSYFWLPKTRWVETIKEFFASALYYENWQLAFNSVDYLAENNEASPVQHFWAMSLQGQFYLVWPLIILLTVLVYKYFLKKYTLRVSTLVVFGLLFTISFLYSIYKTTVDQPWAYFDTFARIWEFSLGGMLAVLISKINLNKIASLSVGWIGLISILLTGLLLPVSTVFPGYVALIPTLSAVLIIVSSKNAGKFGVHRLLSTKPLVGLGGVSYGIYLFHWPILIFYLTVSDRNDVPFTHGLIIILVSILLSYVATNIIEKPIRKIKLSTNRKKLFTIVMALLFPFLIVITVWNVHVQNEIENLNASYEINDIFNYDKELSETLELDDIIPNPLQSKEDIPISYPQKCHQKKGKSEVIECYFGNNDNPEYTVALVGGSHSAHWLPALEIIAEQENMQIVNMTKSGCRFTTDTDVVEDCFEFNKNLIDSIINLNPDIVFTTADIGSRQTIPEGYIEQWETLDEHDIQVFAIRDNGRYHVDPPTCVEEFGVNAKECTLPRDDFMPIEGAWETLNPKPENVYYFETGDFFCDEDICSPIIGNVLAFRDKSHITATFAKALAPYIRPALMEALNN